MKRYLPLGILISVFLLYKLFNLSFRLSDTNIYFYTAYQLLEGKILYKDIFFTNFPLFPYVSMLYFFFMGKSVLAYYFTAALEVSVITLFIHHLVYTKTRRYTIAFSSSLLYLFSFIVIATSAHQTGVFLASLFAVISYYFFEKKQFFFAGIFVACALLTKAYFLPLLVSYLCMLLLQKNIRAFFRFFLGMIATSSIVLLPTLLFAAEAFTKNVFLYSLTRTQGVNKSSLMWFFIQHDFLIFLTLLVNIVLLRKYLFFGIFSLLSLIFIFLYQDVYYLYLNFMVPFLCISFGYHIYLLSQKFHIQKMTIPTVILFIGCFNFFLYANTLQEQQKVPGMKQFIQLVQEKKPTAIYGTNTIAPLLAYETKTPLLNGIVDTNTNMYRKGILNTKQLTSDAIKQKAFIIGHGASYPQNNINQPLIDEIFVTEEINKKCTLLMQLPVYTEDISNRLSLFSCP